jgi:hypothetical protein
MVRRAPGVTAAVCGLLALCVSLSSVSKGQDTIDRNRVKELYEKSQRGDKLTAEEQKYLDRAIRELKKARDKKPDPVKPDPGKTDEKRQEQPSTGLKPLTEMTADDRYKGEDGGLYGGGRNEPPEVHQLAAREALKKIAPLDTQGKPSPNGKIVLIALGMSNTAGEFSMFKDMADRDPKKSPDVLLVNCAIGGAGVSSWANPGSGTWQKVAERLKEAGVTPEQVQVAWIKHADPGPSPDTFPLQYARHVKDKIAASLAVTRSTFPNLRVAYLSSRIYGGYNIAGIRRVNPEPFAYETAYSARWVIQEQIASERKGKVSGPVLLWGPYLWADGVRPRKSDKLVWERKDLAEDGVHPSKIGGRKVANLLLEFFKTDAGAKNWFVKVGGDNPGRP